MYSIGLDISKSTISIHVPLNSLDLEIEKVVFEPTGSYSALMTKFCASKNIKAFIINPKQSSNFAKALGYRSKSDKIDAKMLSLSISCYEKTCCDCTCSL